MVEWCPSKGMKSISVAAPSGLKMRFEHQGLWTIAARDAARLTLWCNEPAAVIGRAQERGETGARVESRQAQPVDRAVLAYEGGRMAVTDQGVVFDAERHDSK